MIRARAVLLVLLAACSSAPVERVATPPPAPPSATARAPAADPPEPVDPLEPELVEMRRDFIDRFERGDIEGARPVIAKLRAASPKNRSLVALEDALMREVRRRRQVAAMELDKHDANPIHVVAGAAPPRPPSGRGFQFGKQVFVPTSSRLDVRYGGFSFGAAMTTDDPTSPSSYRGHAITAEWTSGETTFRSFGRSGEVLAVERPRTPPAVLDLMPILDDLGTISRARFDFAEEHDGTAFLKFIGLENNAYATVLVAVHVASGGIIWRRSLTRVSSAQIICFGNVIITSVIPHTGGGDIDALDQADGSVVAHRHTRAVPYRVFRDGATLIVVGDGNSETLGMIP